MKIYDTCNFKSGVLELHEPNYIIFKGNNGNIEYYKLTFFAFVRQSPVVIIKGPWVNVDPLQDEREIKKVGKKVKKIERSVYPSRYDDWAEFTVIQKSEHTIDVIVDDYYCESQTKPYVNPGDILLRIKTY